jgi:mono/diheme cytochrome c family protein
LPAARLTLLAVGILAAALARAAVDDPAAARVDYMLNCQGCHLPNAAGAPGVVPDLRATLGALLSVPGGREFVQRVPGAATSSLDDARLARVLSWMVREFSTPPDGFVDFSAKETGRLRGNPLIDVKGERARLAIPAGIPAAY